MKTLPPKLARISERMSPKARTVLMQQLQDKEDTAIHITEALNKNGYQVGYTTIKVARRKLINE